MFEYSKKKERKEFDRINYNARDLGLFRKEDATPRYPNERMNQEFTREGLPIHRIQIRESDAGYTRDQRDTGPANYDMTSGGLTSMPDSVRQGQGRWLASLLLQQSRPMFAYCQTHGLIVNWDCSRPKNDSYTDYAGGRHPDVGSPCALTAIDLQTAADILDNPALGKVMCRTHELFEHMKQNLTGEGDLSSPVGVQEDYQPHRKAQA